MRLRAWIRFSAALPLAISLVIPVAGRASVELRSDRIFQAPTRKVQQYVRDGLIVGGDQAINGVVVRDIRRATNAGFERVVLDLEGTRDGEPVAISRAPYFQVAVNRDEKRLVVTLYGAPRLLFDARKVQAAFKKSRLVSKVELLPVLDSDAWTFSLELHDARAVEVFELASPVRLILDVQEKPRS